MDEFPEGRMTIRDNIDMTWRPQSACTAGLSVRSRGKSICGSNRTGSDWIRSLAPRFDGRVAGLDCGFRQRRARSRLIHRGRIPGACEMTPAHTMQVQSRCVEGLAICTINAPMRPFRRGAFQSLLPARMTSCRIAALQGFGRGVAEVIFLAGRRRHGYAN